MTDVADMLAKSAGFALRVQHQRAVEAMVICDALRIRRPRWIRSPDSKLMHQYLANRGAIDGVLSPELLYGMPHVVEDAPDLWQDVPPVQSLEEIRESPAEVPVAKLIASMHEATQRMAERGELSFLIHTVGPEPELASLCGAFACGWYSAAPADSGLVNCTLCLKALALPESPRWPLTSSPKLSV